MNPAQKLKTVAALPTLSPIETLRMIALRNAELIKGEHGETARVTVYLQGSIFTGFVAGVKEDSEGSSVLLVEHDDARTQSINIIYLPVWAIVAVKVHEAEQFMHMLSGGTIEAPKASMGIVTLRHKISDDTLRLRTVLQADIRLEVSWETMTQDDLSLIGLYELIDISMNAIQDVVADEFKRIPFKSAVKAIRFQNGPEAEIHQEDQVLIVRGTLVARADGRFSREEFRVALIELLDDISKSSEK